MFFLNKYSKMFYIINKFSYIKTYFVLVFLVLRKKIASLKMKINIKKLKLLMKS